jgi:BirA family biotin operon repressor/biotin-[acetyl-CoA-carboxylase] ligase
LSWLNLDAIEVVESVDSTQDEIKRRVSDGLAVPTCLLALDQMRGKGRFGREWASAPGESLTMSLVLPSHPKPWLLGFLTALAVASAFHTRLQWPNDLTIKRRKVGGVLTELVDSPSGGKLCVVGVGLNLNQMAFPDSLAGSATSVLLERGVRTEPGDAARMVLERLSGMAIPETWDELVPIWMLFDDTPGKLYKLPTGESATALGLGPEGELICSVEGETRSILAAEALFG